MKPAPPPKPSIEVSRMNDL